MEIGVGTGLNLPDVVHYIGEKGSFVGLDRSMPMLEQARKKSASTNMTADLIGGCGEKLPFGDDVFDTVYVFGSFNVLDDQKETVREMMRVAKPRALIVIADKSLALYKKHDFRKRVLLLLEPHLINLPPLDSIPSSEFRIQTHWLWNDLIYVLSFRNPIELEV